MSGRVVSVNVGRPAPLATGRRVVESAIGKAPVEGLKLEALVVDRGRAGELEPARADMLPKLAAWYEEVAQSTSVAP